MTYATSAAHNAVRRDGNVDIARMVSTCVDDGRRTSLLAAVVARLATEGRCVLVLSERRGHLDQGKPGTAGQGRNIQNFDF